MAGSLGARLREVRRQSGLSQDAFAKAGGVTRNSQTAYEAGTVAPNADYLSRLYNSGFDVFYVLSGERVGQTLAEAEQQLVEAYRAMDSAAQQALLLIAGRVMERERRSLHQPTQGLQAKGQ